MKATKADVDYRQGSPGYHCAICAMYRPPSGCISVEGDIRPNGFCSFFQRESINAKQISEPS